MRKKICILTQSHLCRNPRVVKEALALNRAGYEVVILTTFTFADLLEQDRRMLDGSGVILKGVVNMIPTQAPAIYRFRERLVRRLAGEAIASLSLENVYALGYDYRRNLNAALAEQADLYTCHQEISTVIGCRLIRKGKTVAFDFEDWYSHDLLPAANRTRPLKLLEKHEKIALREGALSYTTSRSMAEALGNFAGVTPPQVLLNAFPFADRLNLDHRFSDRENQDIPSIHWYSQTIGPGRGIEFLTDCLGDVTTPVELHLRGNLFGDFRQEIVRRFPADRGHRLFFHPLVSPGELLSRIAEHDIGLATEEYAPDSRNLTITNKILQYLQAGIAVVATDTSGQREVAREAPEAVFVYRNGDRSGLVNALNHLLDDRTKLHQAKAAALTAAREKFCWETQEPLLINWIDHILKKG